MKLIDKDAVVAEVERRMQCYSRNGCEPNGGKWVELISIKHFLDTLEVKEVDLEKEATRFVQTKEFAECDGSPVLCLAKHFFELGLKAKQ